MGPVMRWIRAAIVLAALLAPVGWAWAIDRAQEDRTLERYQRLVETGCGAKKMSEARATISADIINRISDKLQFFQGQINERRKVLGRPLISAENAAQAQAAELAAARENLKSKQWEFETATMYRSYRTVNVPRAREELAQARARAEALESRARGGGGGGDRQPASTTESIEAERNQDQAASEMADLADLSDRYQNLRDQAGFCLSKNLGYPGEPVQSLYDPLTGPNPGAPGGIGSGGSARSGGTSGGGTGAGAGAAP